MNGFEKLLPDLSRAEADFILVGGLAVAFAGYAHTTEALGLLIDAAPENVERLLIALEDFGEGHARELDVTDFALEEGAIRIVETFPISAASAPKA